jgi:hypothetical protein
LIVQGPEAGVVPNESFDVFEIVRAVSFAFWFVVLGNNRLESAVLLGSATTSGCSE